MQKLRKQGLVLDLWPNLRLIQLSGIFFSAYHDDNSTLMRLVRKLYSWLVTVVLFTQYAFLVVYVITDAHDADQRAAYSVTILFFTHTLIKFVYFSTNNGQMCRTLAMWNNPNSHPLFTESNTRHRAIAVSRMRKLLFFAGGVTIFSTISWTTITFVGDSMRLVPDPETENGTMLMEVPRLMLPSYYPFDVMHGVPYIIVFALQARSIYSCCFYLHFKLRFLPCSKKCK